jgi:predicted metal-dependent peptidase
MSNMSKMTQEQRIQRAHVALMGNPNYCLYSGLFMLGKTEVCDDVPTACTNGRDTKYGREFMGKLSDAELRAVILHENLHKAFQHLTTWRHLYEEDAQTANMACDYVINLLIKDSDPSGQFVRLPECALLDEQYRGMDAYTVYKLLKQKKQGKSNGGNNGGKGGFDEHDWKGAGELSAEEEGQLARDVDRALRQGQLLAGKMKGNVPRELADVLEPKVNWRDALREYITSMSSGKDESTWQRPARRWIAQDIYMPSSISTQVGRIVVGIDTSGSIGHEEIGQFLGEVRSICESVSPDGIDLLYWDTEVCRHEPYERDQLDGLMQSTKPAGGGGTAPACVMDYIRERNMNPVCCIMLTDGYVADWGADWPCPVLWGITTTGITAASGKTVTIQ